ncbi:MAG: serine hydrolase domain-containing protein, partial [Myxococcota bacterium]
LAGERRTELSETQLLNVLGRTRDQGLRLVDLETYAVKGERRYAALLLENNDRFRWSNREAAQQYLESFRAANNAPAASVTVIHNGQVVFQSGSGKADLHEDREANSDTLFLTASVSKTLGGILAVKLSDEDRLQDGTTFNFNVTDRTRSYLENLFYDGNSTEMPRFHQHTIANLLAHRGCVAHYPDPSGDTQTNPATGVTTNTVWTPGINNQTRFYTDALSAAISIWGTNLVTATTTTTTPNPGGAPNTSTTSAPCVIGQNFFYSTPAFTLLGAAMEVATGRNLKQLVNEELFEQFGFERSRVQFTSSQLRPDSNRATPYTGGAGSSRVTSYSDTSWKVLGGGIESTSRELARLGWALLDGQIVDPAARDRWLLNLTTNSSGQLVNDSLGFFAGADPDWRNYFHHGGDATGANA